MNKEVFEIHWRFKLDNGTWSEHRISVLSTDEKIDKFTDWVNDNFYGRDKGNSIIF